MLILIRTAVNSEITQLVISLAVAALFIQGWLANITLLTSSYGT